MRRIAGYKQIRCPDCGKTKVVPIFEEVIEEKPQNWEEKIGESCKCEKLDKEEI